MAAKKSIEYEILIIGPNNTRYLRPVKGYPITLPLSEQSSVQLAVRQDQVLIHLWHVDHVETGFSVCSAESRDEAIDKAIKKAKKHGEEGFAAAIKEAKKRRESIPQ